MYNLVMMLPKYRKRALFIVIGSLMSLYMANKKYIDDRITGKAQLERRLKRENKSSNYRGQRVGVNELFLSQLKKIMPICVPGTCIPT